MKPLKKRKYRRSGIWQPTWQSPLIEYWEMRHRNHPTKPRRKPARRVRLERQIMLMLALFSISIGLWENFRQLWLQQVGFSATDVGNVISMGMLLSVAGIIVVGKTVKMTRIKKFMVTTLAVRSVTEIGLYFLHTSGWWWAVVPLIAIDIVTGALIVTSVYPLLTTVMKSNNAYSRRKLVEYLFRDIGLLIGGVLIGQQLGNWLVDYNACLMISALFSVAAAIVMAKFQLEMQERAPAQQQFSAVKYVLRSKMQRLYMVYVFVAAMSYHTAIGLRMLMLTDDFSLSASMATNFLLIVGLLSDVLGILALRFFTSKNDFVSMALKFGTRAIIAGLAFMADSPFLCFVALAWFLLNSTVYENISDGYYINVVDNRYQLKYNTLRYVVNYGGDAVGMFLAGQLFQFGPAAIMGVAGTLSLGAMILAFKLIRVRGRGGSR